MRVFRKLHRWERRLELGFTFRVDRRIQLGPWRTTCRSGVGLWGMGRKMIRRRSWRWQGMKISREITPMPLRSTYWVAIINWPAAARVVAKQIRFQARLLSAEEL